VDYATSARAVDGIATPTAAVAEWLRTAATATALDVRRIPFSAMREWGVQADTGDLAHRTGRFFSVHGLRVRAEWETTGSWYQPIISQPQVGVLGILARRFGGVPHLLLRAGTEPGTADRVQVCPTVATTRARFLAADPAVPYLRYFAGPGRARALVDAFQSEQGAWFLHKRNRVMLVETAEPVEARDGYRWLTFGQIERLLRTDVTVNMDTRGILGCLGPGPSGAGSTDTASLHTDRAVLGWITELRTRYALAVHRMALSTLPGWEWRDTEIRRPEGGEFQIIAISVRCGTAAWEQPLLAPSAPHLAAFVCRHINGVPHLLARARAEPGFRDTVELGPTVQCAVPGPGRLPDSEQPYAAAVLGARPDQIRYDQRQAEEGNRFHRALTRYVVADLGDDVPLEEPPGYRWLTAAQWISLLRHGGYVNVQARSLLAALPGVWSGR
jgi:oxidase EvaA